MKPKAVAAQYKKDIVSEFVKLLEEYPIIGVVNMEGLPTAQLQRMRIQLRKKDVVLRMAKARLIKIAFENTKNKKKGIEGLENRLTGMPALMFTKENPFKLYKMLQESKSTAPAKPGQKSPKEIVIKAGGTSFAPGPVISELGSVGLKTGVENGKVVIKDDKVVANEGDVISAKLAGVLAKLGIEPMEIGLDLVAVYEDGIIFDKKVLAIDEKEFISKITLGARWAFNLAVESGYPTKETIEFMIGKVFRESKALAIEANIMADAVAEELVAKADVQARMLGKEAGFDVIERKAAAKEEKKEEKPEEPKKEEAPKEEPKPEAKAEEAKPEVKVEEVKPEDMEKVDKIIEETRSFAEGRKPETAEELLAELKEKAKQEKLKEMHARKEKKERGPSAYDLAKARKEREDKEKEKKK